MRRRRLALWFLRSVLVLAIVPGCLALHTYRPLSILVRDAEMKQPIQAAEVLLSLAP